MDHLFREQEIEELQKATGRTYVGGMFKTALYRAEKAEAERVMVYAERVPRTAKEITTITIYRKSEPERRVDLSRVEALRLISELREALAK